MICDSTVFMNGYCIRCKRASHTPEPPSYSQLEARVKELEALCRDLTQGLRDEENHWHHPKGEDLGGRRCTACEALELAKKKKIFLEMNHG